ncbi:baseplate J/gp47 family protein [Acinetobacter baumannii]|uniref:baseplate assembly protein n=1 Tax=Acinetobacter baumannii TaxID=470 RepID=UPI000D352D8B|nr:baseplate J/gp47 family protein [Acinetobacter baumannii]
MAGSLTAIDLSQLPPPEVVEQIDYELILQDGLNDFHKLMQEAGIEYKVLESDPAYKLAEVFAFREMLVRQRANDSSKAVLLAYSSGSDLDHKAAEKNLERRLISEATETSDAIYETDNSLRKRVQLAPEGYTTAGSEGSYLFHAMNADVRVEDIQPHSPSEGIVNIYVLSNEGNGAASEELILIVNKALNHKEIRPLTDYVNVYSASIVEYSIEAILDTGSGPDSDTILAAAADALAAYTKETHGLNQSVTISGIYHALHQAGVKNVDLIQPTQNIVTNLGQAPYCSSVNLSLLEDHDE